MGQVVLPSALRATLGGHANPVFSMCAARKPRELAGASVTLLCRPQISTCHQLLHPQVLQLLVKLFETEHSQLDVMEQVSCARGLLGAGELQL